VSPSLVVAALEIEALIQALVFLLIFLVPVLRQVFGDRSGSKAPKKTDPRPRRRSPGGWEERLRKEFGVDLRGGGDDSEEREEAASPPKPASDPTAEAGAPPPPVERRAPVAQARPKASVERLGSFDTGLGGLIPGRELADVPSEFDVDLADVPSEFGDLAGVPSEHGSAASGDLEDLVPGARTTLGAPVGSRARSLAAGLTIASWRRAVVLSEVLGTPVALREGDETVPGWR